MTDRKKPGVAFWATAVVAAVPLLYVLGFGPACWVCSRVPTSNICWQATNSTYSLVLRAWARDDGRIGEAISWYANLGANGKIVAVDYAGTCQIGVQH